MTTQTKTILFIAAALTVGGIALYRTGEHAGETSHEAQQASASYPRGPHRGRLFTEGDFSFEVSIYETGVEPQFRLYGYQDGKPIAPEKLKATATVTRLGDVQEIQFKPEADYLLGDQIVYEPHSFDVSVSVQYAGKSYQWQYSSYEGRLQMQQASLASGGIVVETAGPQTIASILTLPGEVKIKHDKRVQIVPRVAGVVTSIPHGLGATVKKGQTLLVLESRELALLKSDYLTAREQLELSQATFRREQSLWQQKITAEQDYLQAQKAVRENEIAVKRAAQSLQALGLSKQEIDALIETPSALLNRLDIRAPFDGVIINRQVAIGASVTSDTAVFELANIVEMEVEVAVYAQHLSQIQVGQLVKVRALNADMEAEGKISYLSNQLAERSRAAIAHVEFPNQDGRWREGQFVETDIVLDEVTVPVAVKADAIQTFRDWQVVFAQYGDQYEIRPVELGRSDGTWIEVVEGIAAGQAYVAENAFVMKAELGKSGATHDH